MFAHQCADPDRGPTEAEVIEGLVDWEADRDEHIEIIPSGVEIPDTEEVAFWKQTAVELYDYADEAVINEHLSGKQVERLQDAKTNLLPEERREP
jgi:hypothetical protein